MADPTDFVLETPEDKAIEQAMRNEVEVEPVEEEAAPEEKAPEPEIKAEEKAPEPKVEEPVKEEPKKQVRLVPHEALHEERVKRQQLEARLRELEAKAAPQPQAPKATDDPIGALEQTQNEVAELRAFISQQAEERALAAQVGGRVNSYAKEHPEYVDQVNYLRQSRATELRVLGHDDAAIVKQLEAEEMSLGRLAIQKDLDPGAMIATMAVARGWQAKAPAKEAEPAKEPAKVDSKPAEEKIDRLARGQKAAISPSGAGGGAAAESNSIEDLLKLNGAAFDKAVEKFNAEMKRAGA